MKKTSKKEEFEFCGVCKLNHDQGRRHNFFPNHKKSLSSFLARFQAKLSDVRIFLKNPSLLRQELSPRNRIWCVFCDCDLDEVGSSYAWANVIVHLASATHLKNLKGFLWKYGGEMNHVDSFHISEADLAKWEKNCKNLKMEAAGGGSHGHTIGPSNDIHNKLNSEYVDTFDKNNLQSLNSSFSNGVEPLQSYTNEQYQVSSSELYGAAEVGAHLRGGDSYMSTALHIVQGFWSSSSTTGCQDFQRSGVSDGTESSAAGYVNNGATYQAHQDKRGANGETNSPGFHNLTPISSRIREGADGNVHSGADPPWLDAVERNQADVRLKPGLGMSNTVFTVGKSGKSTKLNSKRVGAAWAERRKIEMEMEKRGEVVSNSFDDKWLPNFGRVWQTGSRRESMKEFEVESRKHHNLKTETEPEPEPEIIQLLPYVSKRMRKDASE